MRLTHKEREDRRFRAVEALARGLSQREVAEMFETSVASVSQWKRRFHVAGPEGLAARPQGRPPRGRPESPLDGVRRTLLERRPESEGLPRGVWDGRSVGRLIARATGAPVSRWTVPRYLSDWGLAPPDLPAGRAVGAGLQPHEWLSRTLPALRAEAGARRAAVFLIQTSNLAAADGHAGQGEHWALWARRPRGDWSFIIAGHRPQGTDLADLLARLQVHAAPSAIIAVLADESAWGEAAIRAVAAGLPHKAALRRVAPGASAQVRGIVASKGTPAIAGNN